MSQIRTGTRPSPLWGPEYNQSIGQEVSRILDTLQADLNRVAIAVNNARATAANSDTTPSVIKCGQHGMLELSNTGATSVTTLDDGIDLQVVTLKATTANTTLVHSATFRLSGSVNRTMATNDCITMMKDLTIWREISRTNA